MRSDLLKYLNKYDINYLAFSTYDIKNIERVEEIVNLCDGVILPGGNDYNKLDIDLVKLLYKKNIPTLGICLGMQAMAVAFNGNLKTLDDDNHQSTNKYVHYVIINDKSRLYKIIKKRKIKVNSRHNDYIVNTNLDVSGKSYNDSIIEAVEEPTKKFFIGVQWHPESLENDLYSKRLFDSFIKSIK